MKAILSKLRPSKRLVFILSAALSVSAASGGAAVYVGRDRLIARLAKPAASGLECTTLRTLKLDHKGQRWIRMHVKTDRASGPDRVRTALRVVGALANREKADLYQVVVLDAAGPKDRAAVRGAAIGAEVLFAPGPQSVKGMDEPFRASYNAGSSNAAGLFQGKMVSLKLDEVRVIMAKMDDRSLCLDPSVANAEGADGGEGEQTLESVETPASH
ncbi:hypothetical protein PYH37_005460 [Sinorhizobium numidicum]|uniref:Uncharacterized protein n=1 Tax=Sinorhizobium numidicum TaxID=680248 RepID=A0ABY8CYM1_9HYPH|nr:hypothetical protein [Sinorhizobium numidicum]WEX77090.1 hypothetical protein PYH37_005460 [Sinorhizobium numidicum]WEX83749.1 hypothetical protein PYH38_002553 [Sinorhizobium numidicum]